MAKVITPSDDSRDDLAMTVLHQAAELPLLELYPERNQFLKIVSSECQNEIKTL